MLHLHDVPSEPATPLPLDLRAIWLDGYQTAIDVLRAAARPEDGPDMQAAIAAVAGALQSLKP